MRTRVQFIRECFAAAATASVSSLRALSEPQETALDRYIATPTPEFHYEVVKTVESADYRFRVLSMTSQQWRDSREVDKPLWTHWLTITEPRRRKTNIGVLVITGGSNTEEAPNRVDRAIEMIAGETGAVIAVLHGVPNQPLTFAADGTPRSEDDLVAYSWDRYLRTGDETWPLRLPMTKAAIRAMDTVAAVTSSGSESAVDRFVVGGSSKRGWTSWLVAAADKRVVGVVPVVIDVLNIESSALHAYRVYGKWPEALASYEKMGIMNWFGTPQLAALLRIEDPYSYRSRVAVPKLVLNATGDQFFTPDSSQFYFDGLIGEKYLRYLPNTDHSLGGATINAARTAIAFLNSIIEGGSLPEYRSESLPDGEIVVRTRTEPLLVKLWQATNPKARDFRVQTIGRAFHATPLSERTNRTYAARVAPPAHGFTAYFIELTFLTSHDDLFVVTSGVRVTPDRLPFAAPGLHRPPAP